MLHGIGPIRSPKLGVGLGRRPVSRPGRVARARDELPDRCGNASGSRRARIAMYSVVHGPTPGNASSRRRASVRSAPASITSSSRASAVASASRQRRRASASTGGARHREPVGVHADKRLGRWEDVRDRSERTLEPLTVTGDEPARERAGAPQRDLLSEHGAHGELVSVDGARYTPARGPLHQRPEQRLAAENRGDAARVGIEVEQRARALHGAGEIAQIVQPIARVHVPVGGRQLDDARAVWQAQTATVRALERLLDTGHGAKPEEGDQPLSVQRRAVGQAQRQRPTVLRAPMSCAHARAARSASSRTPPAPSR